MIAGDRSPRCVVSVISSKNDFDDLATNQILGIQECQELIMLLLPLLWDVDTWQDLRAHVKAIDIEISLHLSGIP